MKLYSPLRYLIFLAFLFGSYISQAQYYPYVDPNTRTLDITTAKAGTLPGSIDITSIGEAVYEIPLFISPGTAGLQPRISIVYSSNIEDGVLGRGFTIGGLSEIRRIPQNFYHDNNVKGVTLQNTDKFALDSIRLILTSQGQYGADGTEYATEIETFVKVIAHGSAGTGPSWFEVQTKDGRIIEYGNTVDSKIEATGSNTIYMWRINRIKDPNNNYIDFKYEESNGESIIKEIKYTGNSATGLQPYNKIRFSYSSNPRADLNTYYVAGSQVPSTKLLDSIRVVTEGNTLVREYRFKYNNEFYTHLNQITEYGSDQTFFNSTIFGWGATQNQFLNNNAFNNSKKDKFYLGDFNGDGRTDFVVTENKTSFTTSDKWKLYLATSTGTSFTYVNEGNLNSQFKGFYVVDADGNGKDDILWRAREIVYYQCNPHPCDNEMMAPVSISADTVSISDSSIVDFLNPPPPQDTCWDQCSYYQEAFRYYYYNDTILKRGSASYDLVYQNAPADITMTPADLDGNGKPDYLLLSSLKNIYAISGISYNSLPDLNSPGSVSIVDFNGDGKKDILVIKNSNSIIYSFNSLTGYFETVYSNSSFPTINDRIFPGDYNGDKKTDLLYWRNGSGWSLKFSTGTSFVTSSNIPGLINTDPGASTTDNNYYIGDFNGDRKDDIIESNKSSSPSKLKRFFSRGILFADPETNTYSKSAINQEYFQIGDFNGDGKKDLFYYDNSLTTNYVNICFFHKDELKHLVNTISNGFGLNTRLIYDRLNSGGTFYTKGTGATFPVKEFNGAYYAVSSIWDFNSYGDTTINEYKYQSAKIHVQGKGFLGFMKTITRFKKESMVAEKTFDYNTTYFNVGLNDYVYKGNNEIVSNTSSYTNQVYSYGNKRIFPYVGQVDAWDNLNKIITQTCYAVDNNGNLTYSSTSYKNENQSVDAIKYHIYNYGTYGNWGIPNKVTLAKDSTKYNGEPAYIRKTSYQYNSAGNLIVTTGDPGKSKEVTKSNSCNSYGLAYQVSISANGLATRTTTFEFDSKYRFITKETNPAGHFSTMQYIPGTGNLQSVTGIDNKTTSYQYDGFGRLIKTINPLGHEIIRTISWDDEFEPPATPSYMILTNAPGKPLVWETFNGSGQKTYIMTLGINGYVKKEFIYDLAGRLLSEKGPHYTSDWQNAPYTYYTYDQFSRITQFYNSISGNTVIIYNGRKTTEIYPGNKRKETTINSSSDIISIKENDDNNLITNYSYHSSGQVKQVTSAGTTVSITYDEYANPISVTNPNSGTSYSSFNAFGQKVSYTDPKPNASFNYYYDILGRLDHFTSPEGTTNYSYNTSGDGIEQVHSVTGPGNNSFSYQYDEFGRLICFNENIPDDQAFTTSLTYNVYGNDSTMTYPGGFNIRKVYENGYLREIRDANNSLIWRLDSLNSFGSPRKYILGSNGLTTAFRYNTPGFLTKKITGTREQSFNFDTQTGNLMSRGFKKGTMNLSESFTYDNLERLTSSTVSGRSPVNITYDSNGNILSKTGVGNYCYNIDKLNAVDSIINNQGSIPVTTQAISYTSFNKVSEITDSINKNSIRLDIIYGPDQQRIRNTFYQNDTITRIRYYSIDYEKDSTSAAVKQIYYINCPYGLVAVNIRQNGNDSLYFVDTDHLGSILALLRSNGSEAEKYSFDAWGRRRNPTDWTYDNVPALILIDRGYTGHEHYDLFGLIDMNGRVYDPVIGRFLSPDPIIQAPEFTQCYNSYSYCVNNPLKWIDPTGFSAVKIAKENWQKFLTQADAGLPLEFLCEIYKSNEALTEQELINDFLILMVAIAGGGGGPGGSNSGSLCYGGQLSDMLKAQFGEQYYDVYENTSDPKQKALEDKLILLANRLALHELGFNFNDIIKDTHSYGENSTLYSKLSKLDNYQYYTANWESKTFNSSTFWFNAKTSPEIGLTGFALKYYPKKNGEANALGLVIKNPLGHRVEGILEGGEYLSVKYLGYQDDWLYDMHLINSILYLEGY